MNPRNAEDEDPDDIDEADEPDSTKRILYWMVGIPAGLFVLVLLMVIFDSEGLKEAKQRIEKREAEERAQAAKPDKIKAWVAMQGFVNDRLKSPATADYGGQNPKDIVTETGEGEYSASAWVDSQNAFGAMIRTEFACEVRYAGDDRWELVRLDFLE